MLTAQRISLTAKIPLWEDPPPSEQPRLLIYKVAPLPYVVETFERLREFGR